MNPSLSLYGQTQGSTLACVPDCCVSEKNISRASCRASSQENNSLRHVFVDKRSSES